MPLPFEQAETAPHILVIDDDHRLRQLLSKYLGEQGMLVMDAENAQDAQAKLAVASFDALVMDVMMPGQNGIELTRQLRQSLNTPIILLTARGEAEDRISGLEAGADDYLPKPFEPRELLLRLQIILRRNQSVQSQPVAPQIIRLGRFHYQSGSDALKADDASIRLGSVEVKLLQALLAAPHHSLSRDELANLLELDAPRSVDVHVARLRRKLGDDPRDSQIIQTLRGNGYLLRVGA